MAKSLRSKTKRAFRHKKRETGEYAAAAAARLHRLNSKLIQVTKRDADGDVSISGEEDVGEDVPEPKYRFKQNTWVIVPSLERSLIPLFTAPELETSIPDQPDSMAVDGERPMKISTHGPRGSRREEWRKSKGMPARAVPDGMNRQGGVAAKRKAGRSKRRR